MTVKFGKQTPLLSILEEACSKRKLDPALHALRKESDRSTTPNLDLSLTAMFAGIPNHCKLEVVPSGDGQAKPTQNESEETVRVALQVDGAGRFQGKYSPLDTLDKITSSSGQKVPDELEPIVIYMRQEIIGQQALSETSLKSLGLTSGSAVLRLIFRAPESLKTQANSVDMKMTSSTKEPVETPWRAMRKDDDNSTTLLPSPVASIKKDLDAVPEGPPISMDVDQSTPPVQTDKISDSDKDKVQKMDVSEEQVSEENAATDRVGSHVEVDAQEEDPVLHYLDEDHSSVVYKLSDGAARIKYDVSEDFFDLTIEDAKVLLRDTRKQQREDQEEVLMTRQMRESQKEGHKLAMLSKYKRAVIRIQLPDRHVIQAIFMSGAPLSDVIENAKRYLNVQGKVQLFVTPPKVVLNPTDTLLDLGLVPAALVYMSIEEQNEGLLKGSLTLSNQPGAEKALTDSGVLCSHTRNDRQVEMSSESTSSSSSSGTASGGASSTVARMNVSQENAPTVKRQSNAAAKSTDSKVPRWFKPSKS